MKRGLFALLIFGLFAVVVGRTIDSAQRELMVTEVCEAASERRWDEALDEKLALTGTDDAAHGALECRCLALLMKGDRPRCLQLLERAVGQDESWLPDPLLTHMLLEDWISRGDAQRALSLATAASEAHPEDRNLLAREIDARALLDSPEAAFDFVQRRVGAKAPFELRFALAERALHYELPERALAILGPRPPPREHPEHYAYFTLRGDALGMLGRERELAALMDQWRAAGAKEGMVLAHHGVIRSQHQLWDGKPSVDELLAGALVRKQEVEPQALIPILYLRRLSSLVADEGRQEEALRVLREARALYPDFPIEERDVLMSDQARLQVGVDADAPRGLIAFTAPPHIGGVIKVAPDLDAPVDAPHEPVPVAKGQTVSVQRVVGRWPVRWVFVDDKGATRASGSVWPVERRTVTVAIEARPPARPERYQPSQAPGDGRHRVFLVILDSVDWRLVTYLMARGELPFMSSLYESGLRAVLDSNPAFTAAAMKTLTRPDEPRALTMPIALHGLGEQLATFFQIGANPVDALSLIVPNEPDLFQVLSRGDLVIANMLHGHGGLNAGEHGATWGPGGAKGELELSKGRALTDDERARFSGLGNPSEAFLNDEVADSAAQLDDAVRLAREKQVDLLLLRVPATDHAAHATYASASRGGQDDGDHFLYWLYRYSDARLGELYSALDADDVLVVMSDHGISSHMAHDRRSLFLVGGGSLPAGRSNSIVSLRGLPRMLAELLGVKTEWQKSGLEGWVKLVYPPKGEAAPGASSSTQPQKEEGGTQPPP